MNLEQMCNSIRVRLGAPPTDTFYTDAILYDLVNESLQTISVEGEWPWLQVADDFVTVAGTSLYTPPADWQLTKTLSIDGFDAMVLVDLQEIRNWPSETRDVPMFYTTFNEQILLAPTPVAVYTVRHDYIRQEPPLLLTTDTPFLPRQYHFSVIAMATHLAHLRAGDLPRAQAAEKEYNNWLTRMEGRKRRTASPQKVRVRPGRDY